MSKATLPGILSTSFMGLRSHKVRTLTAAFAMAWGTATLVAILSVIKGFEMEGLARAAELGGLATRSVRIHRGEGKIDLPRLIEWVDSGTSSNESAAALLEFQEEGLSARGMSDHYFDFIKYEVAEGRSLCSGDQFARSRVCVIGSDVAERLGPDAVGTSLEMRGQLFTIVGTLTTRKGVGNFIRGHSGWKDTVVHIPLTVAMEEFPDLIWAVELYGSLDDRGKPVTEAPLSVPAGTWYNRWDEIQKAKEAAERHKVGAWALIWVSIGMACLGVITVISTGVSERIAEIGVRRALGASSSQIMAQYMAEAAGCGFLGSALGFALAEMAVRILTYAVSLPRAVTPIGIVYCFLVGPVCGMVAGLVPAIMAARIDPIKAIRLD